MSDGFQAVLDHIRSTSSTDAEKGRLFERLMKAFADSPNPLTKPMSKIRMEFHEY